MHDVVVIGGGPVGLATAIGCRREGLTVCLIERGRPARDKACGEGLMPPAVAALARLGVAATDLGYPFAGIRYLVGSRIAEGRFPSGQGVGVRRTTLQASLAEKAEACGVDCRWEQRVEGIAGSALPGASGGRIETSAGVIESRFIVGADGLLSAVRSWSGLSAPDAHRRRFGIRRHYRIAPWSDCVEVSWARRSEAYVTPVGPDLVGVAMLWSGTKASFESLLDAFPDLRNRLAGVELASRDRGAGPFEQRTRGLVRGRVALVGDAAGYLDAITGEGIGLGLRQAEALAATLATACRHDGDLAPYVAEHRRIGRRVGLVTRGLLGLESFPLARRGLFGLFGRYPTLFSRVLGWMAASSPAPTPIR